MAVSVRRINLKGGEGVAGGEKRSGSCIRGQSSKGGREDSAKERGGQEIHRSKTNSGRNKST